jgi:hypothetical protein
LFIAPTPADLAVILAIQNDPIPLSRGGYRQVYHTLGFKRGKWKINHLIGAFKLRREQLTDFVQENCMQWEYFAMQSPIWRDRLATEWPSASIDHVKKQLVFQEEDHAEEFYQAYGFELDEQPSEVILLSHAEIPPIDSSVWLQAVFPAAAAVAAGEYITKINKRQFIY